MSDSTLERYLNMQEMRTKLTPAMSAAAFKKYLQISLFDENDPVIF